LRRFLISVVLLAMVPFGIQAVLQNLFLLRLGFNDPHVMFDIDARFIGLMMGLGQLAWAIAALPAGNLSSRLGLRNGILLGQAVNALALALLLLVERLPPSLWPAWLIGCQVVMMVGVAFITVSISPYLMHVTGEQERRHAFAVFQATIAAMSFVGSLIAGVLPGLLAGAWGLSLEGADPYRLALWVGPFLILLSMLPLRKADPGKTATSALQQAAGEPAPWGLLAFFGLLVYLLAIGEGTVRTFYNVYLDRGLAMAPAQIGIIMGVAQLLPIFAALSTPLLIARWGISYALVCAALGSAASLSLLATVPAVWAAALAYMGVNAMLTVVSATRDLMGQELVTPWWRTTISGVGMIGLALGWATAGVVGGYLIAARGFDALFFAGAVSALLAVVLIVAFRRTRRTPAPAPAVERAVP
jgi:MFS family permease